MVQNADEGDRAGGQRRRGAAVAGAGRGSASSDGAPLEPESDERRARDAVYQLLATRARSRAELMRALRRKGIEEDTADGVLQKFVDVGLVDDAAFAEHWVESRQRHQRLGRKALGFELRRKGIDEGTVADALSQVDEQAEVERARELVRRKLPAMASLDGTTKARRLLGMLARKGYPESLAFRVVREELENSGTDDNWEEPEYRDW